MSNPLQNQKRNLKPTVSAGAYSASPSQLTLGTDQLPSTALGQNPYQAYGYPHDPNNPFAFPPPPQYRHPQIPQQQQLKTDYTPQQLQQPGHLPSPINPRKRRASELNEPSLPGSSSSNASAFGVGNPHGPFSGGATDVELGLAPVQHTLPSPAPKKGRTNTPWTPAEEQRLKTLRDAGSSWSEIAKTFPLRTEGSVKKHWYKDMHYAEFAEDEVSNFSAALLQAIKDYENNKWKVIGQKVGKPAKACEQFAKEQGWKV
ncbi:hypothetical protein WHR41_00133 [Cladosporium halotolerans]|uniref:Uncharacterized protein n=1 Tax=Cladosporium halotolerans TaxID=1052096 RepID=A0AB34L4X8_9PEZI